mmetsp:Transcript_15762/g.39627  ORF Transcript_15762/g.39627 Transcript_15762/m.39627 type:complete len:300 (+) Transcript_15762:198-1097(+)
MRSLIAQLGDAVAMPAPRRHALPIDHIDKLAIARRRVSCRGTLALGALDRAVLECQLLRRVAEGKRRPGAHARVELQPAREAEEHAVRGRPVLGAQLRPRHVGIHALYIRVGRLLARWPDGHPAAGVAPLVKHAPESRPLGQLGVLRPARGGQAARRCNWQMVPDQLATGRRRLPAGLLLERAVRPEQARRFRLVPRPERVVVDACDLRGRAYLRRGVEELLVQRADHEAVGVHLNHVRVAIHIEDHVGLQHLHALVPKSCKHQLLVRRNHLPPGKQHDAQHHFVHSRIELLVPMLIRL